jgi:hypothetical protein
LIQIKACRPDPEIRFLAMRGTRPRDEERLYCRLVGFVPVSATVEEVMKFINAAFVSALAVIATAAPVPRGEAAPLPTNVAAMKASLNQAVVQVRYGGWRGGWGYRGWGGHRGWGYGGLGYRGWGLGGVAAGAVIGGAIASSAYYGGYPYYGGGYHGGGYYGGGYYGGGYYGGGYYGGGYAQDYCPEYGYGGSYPGYYARRHYYAW